VSPTRFDVEGAGCRLRAYDWGNAAAPSMLLLHGIEDFALALEPIAEAFRQDFHVVAYDLRGHGDSDKPGCYAFPHYLADLLAVLSQVDLDRPVLIGHSLGGMIASQFAGVFPDLPRALVNLDGLGPSLRRAAMDDEEKQWRTQEGLRALLSGGRPGRPMGGAEDAVELYLRFHPRLDREVARRMVELGTTEHPHGGLRWKFDPRVRTLGLTAVPEHAEERFTWIRCPALVVTAGELDEFFVRSQGLDPETAVIDRQEIARRVALIRGASHRELPGAGHHLHFDAPEELAAVVREFLGSLE